MHLWIKDCEILIEMIKASNKRVQALKELAKSKRISKETFEHIKRDHESGAKNIEERRKVLLENFKTYCNELDKQIMSLEERTAGIETGYAAEEINEESYKKQVEALKIALQGVIEESESVKNSISTLEASEIETQLTLEEELEKITTEQQ